MTEGQSIDREQFLKDHKLGDVLDIFTKRDITIEELLEFDKPDLKLFAKEIGLDALSQNRLVKAITKMRPTQDMNAAPASSTPGMTGFGSTGFTASGSATHVIVSPEEHDAISKLYERYEDSSKLIVSLKESFDLLKQSAAKCKIDVNEGFDGLVVNLENKKKELIEEAKTVRDTKKEKLMHQLQQLKEYCSDITNGKKQYEQYISDPNMDIHKRKHAILSMIDDILHNKKVQLVMVTQPKMAFDVDNKQVTKFMESLMIDDCDQPFAPLLNITKIEHDRIVIHWLLDPKYQTNNTKKVLAFEVSWCKLPKSYLKVDEKQKKKKKSKKAKKKKKKGKKKKRKKRAYDSSSDSSNTSESDKDEVESEEEEAEPKQEGIRSVTGAALRKKLAQSFKQSADKKSKKKKKSDTDTESDSDSSSSSSDSESDSDSDSDSSSDSSSSDSSSDSSSNSSSDSEEEEKRSARRKKKKRGKEIKIEYEIMDEFKEIDDMKWEKEEIRIKKEREIKKRYKYVIDEVRDNTAYCIRIRGRNASGWGQYTKLVKIQTPKMVIASKILKAKEMGYLMKVLPKKLKSKRYKLLFRASKDGFASQLFHSKCNNKGATITFVQSMTNHIFGGYTSFAWSSAGSYKQDPNAFIFLLRSSRKKGSLPQKWNVTNVSNAVQHNASYGPTFGGGHDFYLCNNCNSVNSSYSNLGHSYSAPKDQSMLAGSYNFMVKDYEVWQIK